MYIAHNLDDVDRKKDVDLKNSWLLFWHFEQKPNLSFPCIQGFIANSFFNWLSTLWQENGDAGVRQATYLKRQSVVLRRAM